jgi:uncharacterized protein (TIGR01777 family)
MERVIVTGGTGLVGSRLVPMLSRQGYQVVVLTRNINRKIKPALRNVPNVQFIQWDGLSGAGWGHLIEPDTTIINLACQNIINWRWTKTHKRIVVDSRIASTRAIVHAIRNAEQRPKAVLQASSIGYYGDRGELAIGEMTSGGKTWYAEVCKLWEQTSQSLDELGVRRVVLRIGTVLERGHGILPFACLATRTSIYQFGNGKQWLSWIHNADVAGSITHLINQDNLSGNFNLVAPYPVTNREFMTEIAKMLNWGTLFPLPKTLNHWVFGEMASLFLHSQRVYTTALLDSGYVFQHPEVEHALKDLIKGV